MFTVGYPKHFFKIKEMFFKPKKSLMFWYIWTFFNILPKPKPKFNFLTSRKSKNASDHTLNGFVVTHGTQEAQQSSIDFKFWHSEILVCREEFHTKIIYVQGETLTPNKTTNIIFWPITKSFSSISIRLVKLTSMIFFYNAYCKFWYAGYVHQTNFFREKYKN